MQRACTRRWSWRSRGCISCARRCWITSTGFRCRSAMRCGPRSASQQGGLAAAAAFLDRSVLLTADPARRADRMLAAAQASMQAGAFGKALELLAAAEGEPLD